jgi:hypothetical protein
MSDETQDEEEMEEQTKKQPKQDPEILAMRAVARIFADLEENPAKTEGAEHRVLRWIAAKYGMVAQ